MNIIYFYKKNYRTNPQIWDIFIFLHTTVESFMP